jgi:hypothetical protein
LLEAVLEFLLLLRAQVLGLDQALVGGLGRTTAAVSEAAFAMFSKRVAVPGPGGLD